LPQQERHGQAHRRVERNLHVEREGFERGVDDEAVVQTGQNIRLRIQVVGQAHALRDDRASGVDRLIREEAELTLRVTRDPRRDRRADRDHARAEFRHVGEDIAASIVLTG